MAEVAQADHFLIPLLDGHFALGQVFETSADGVLVGLTSHVLGRHDPVRPLPLSAFHAVVFVAITAFTDENWPIIGYDTLPNYDLITGEWRSKKTLMVDVPALDPSLIEAFMNASHGLYPWDGFPDPKVFDRLLLNPQKRPEALRFKSEFAR